MKILIIEVILQIYEGFLTIFANNIITNYFKNKITL
jgi:hypothetical protein